MSARTTWRLSADQLADLDLLARGLLDPLTGWMTAQQVSQVRASGSLGGAPWPVPVPLVVSADAVEDGDDVALLDPEGVTLALLSGARTTPSDRDGVLVHGSLRDLRPLDDADFADLRPSAQELRGGEVGHPHALVTDLPPPRALLAALDELAGGAVVVLLLVPVDVDDLTHTTVMAWRAAAARQPSLALALVPLGPDDGRRPLAVVAARSAGCGSLVLSAEAAAVPGSPEAELAGQARRLGLDPVLLPGVAPVVAAGRPQERPHRADFDDEVWPYVRRADPEPAQRGATLFFTGLSGAGKSTVARAVTARLRRAGRRVTLLDGDVVRQHLSSGLTFSAEDRRTNVLRIAWVAGEVARHGGVAVCAPIAPYEELRREARRLAGAHGLFVLVHVATPVEECERRDRKGLYAQARAGVIPSFTGVSDPYEEPTAADLRIDTTDLSVDEAADRVLGHLRGLGLMPDPPVTEGQEEDLAAPGG